LKRDYDALFGSLPERARLEPLLKTHQDWCDWLLADLSFFLVTVFNVLLGLFHQVHPEAPAHQMSNAEFSL
jgi:hypothetical protein